MTTTYRCFFMDRSDRISGASVVSARNDHDAIGFAIAQLYQSAGVAVEIWHGARRVALRPRLELA